MIRASIVAVKSGLTAHNLMVLGALLWVVLVQSVLTHPGTTYAKVMALVLTVPPVLVVVYEGYWMARGYGREAVLSLIFMAPPAILICVGSIIVAWR